MKLPGPIVAAVLVLPVLAINPWAWSGDLFGLVKDLIVQIVIVFAVVAAVIRHGHRAVAIPVGPVSVPLLGLLIVGSVSAWRSVDPLFSFRDVLGLALLVTLFHVLLDRTEAERRVCFILRTMALVGTVGAVYGIVQFAGADPITTAGRFSPHAFFGNKNFAAEFIVLVLPPTLALVLLAARPAGLVFWTGGAVLQVVHLAATQARAAAVGLAVGQLVAAGLWRLGRPAGCAGAPSSRRWGLVVGIIALGYAVFLVPRPLTVLEPVAAGVLSSESTDGVDPGPRTAGSYAGPSRLLTSESLELRLKLWRAGLRLIAAHPWTGVGPGNVGVVFPLRYETVDTWWPEWIPEPFLHNEVLQIAAEFGVTGLVFALWVVVLLGVMVARTRGDDAPIAQRLYRAATLGALVAFGIASLAGFGWHLPAHRLYVVALASCLVVLTAPPTRRLRLSRGVALVGAAGLALIAVLGPVRLLVAEAYFAAAQRALHDRDFVRARAAYRDGTTLVPEQAARNELVRRATDPRPQYDRAVQWFREVLDRDPADTGALFDLGRALQGAGRLEEAAGVLRQVLAMTTPQQRQARHRLIQIAAARARPDEAEALYRGRGEGMPCDGPLLFNVGLAYQRAGYPAAARARWQEAVECEPALARMAEAWLAKTVDNRPRDIR